MKVYDMHIHSHGTETDTKALMNRFESAGVYGGCVFSQEPKKADFDTRLETVLQWAVEDRVYPVIWIHPYEENILENIDRAVDRGIAAFKMICSDYYVYEAPVLEVIKKIASRNKPVIFHSGILWDGQVSSQYNRPLHFEALLDIEGLRFSMGHCAWPWVDECIALYGKFANALRNKKTSEMFFDITPGTPEIYRKELLSKLYTVGYDVGDNILFGTDASAEDYSVAWSTKWQDIDRKILDELGISLENREKLYHKNLMRFLGLDNAKVVHKVPREDESAAWSGTNPEVKEIIRKWYKELGFPKAFDQQFKWALENVPISDAITWDRYDLNCQDGLRNLLSYLYFCEDLEKRYQRKGIDRKIMMDTIADIVTYTELWSEVKGTLYLGELGWLNHHFGMKLYRLGRLQFYITPGILEIHIPAKDSLDFEACKASIAAARVFYKTYYPESKFEKITCHSWLLDSTLKNFLPQDSNILKFQSLFNITREDDSYVLLRYIFRWDTSIYNLKSAVCTSSLSEKVKKYALKGGMFHESMGEMPW